MEAADADHAVVDPKTMTGTLFGVGVGPGDPELLTLKALRVLRESSVVAYPVTESGEKFARRTVAEHLTDRHIELPVPVPMRAGRDAAQRAYDRAAADIAGHLDGGRDVAVLCVGDPFFYGTFMSVFERLSGRYRGEVVPGITSLSAGTAALECPLVCRNEVLTVLPAPLPEESLRRRLEETDAAVIIKVGRHVEKVQRILTDLGLLGNASYIEHATLPKQRILPLAHVDPGAGPYFSTVFVLREGRPT